MDRQSDGVLVVGGGVVGVCSAFYLARKGFPVTLLERGEVCAGSSFGNAGLVVPSHSVPLAAPGVLSKALRWLLDPESPFYVKPRPSPALLAWLWRFRGHCTEAHVRRAAPVLRDLHYASLGLYRELASTPGLDFAFEQRGALEVFRTEAGAREGAAAAKWLADAGVPVHVLDAGAVREAEPALAAGAVGGLLVPDDAHLVPDELVKGLARMAERLGVRVETRTEVRGFRRGNGRVVAALTPAGEVACGAVVLATGSWSPGVARGLGLALPVEPAKGYSVTVPAPAAPPARPLILSEAKVAVTPMRARLRFAGTLELSGLDLGIAPRRVAAIRRAAREYLDDPGDLEGGEVWAGLRPCTPDGLPVVGRAPGLPNVVVATGHAMIGVSTGPVTGLLVAQILAGERPIVDLAPLSPARFRRA